MTPLIADNLRLLEQGVELLGRLSDEGYVLKGAVATVGPHLRHVLDHYRCLLLGLDRGVVDYEDRPRDPLLEQNRVLAIAEARRLSAALRALPESRVQGPVQLASYAGPLAEQDNGRVQSSIERELQFVLLHTVHHYALIAAEMRLRGVPVERGFGVAPATLGYQARQEALRVDLPAQEPLGPEN